MSSQPQEPSTLVAGKEDDELVAMVALVRSRAVPVNSIAALLDNVGSAVELVQLSEEDRLFAPPATQHQVIGAVTSEDLAVAKDYVTEWRRQPLDIRTLLDASYPANLRTIFNLPPFVFFKGTWREELDCRSIAIVGTRSASEDSRRLAYAMSQAFVEASYTIISGLAAGIDASAHTAATVSGGRTVAVMGTGLNHIYPRENEGLAKAIVDKGGALISQFFPHQGPTKWTFPMRNIVMSGLSLATVVVEAREKSGAKMQARAALQHGRAVFLLKSLVSRHEWARRYVTEGAYDTQAIEVESAVDVIDRLEGNGLSELPLAV